MQDGKGRERSEEAREQGLRAEVFPGSPGLAYNEVGFPLIQRRKKNLRILPATQNFQREMGVTFVGPQESHRKPLSFGSESLNLQEAWGSQG
jgi:hypothetical protein